jgi:serine/threonine-protein kinase RsbW
VRDLCLKHVAAIQLFLPLTDPLTYSLTEEFEAMEFFFSGILPMSCVGDSLILQYLNDVVIDYDKIVLYTDLAKEIRDYVKSHDPYLSLTNS